MRRPRYDAQSMNENAPRVGMDVPERIEIDGGAATVEELWAAVFTYGHFTAMQVRDLRTRGIELHLRRLDAATGELFVSSLEGDRVRELIRHALADRRDASVRVYVFSRDGVPSVIVTVRPPGGVPTVPQRLEPIVYQRPLAHIKRVGGFAEIDHTSLAKRHGYDGSLLTGPEGEISEGGIANIGFFEGPTVVWPAAPHLHGITMQLLEGALAERGTPSRRASVSLADVSSFEGAFLTNARGIVAIGTIGDQTLSVDEGRMRELQDTYASVPWNEI
jgi:branched-subunit amino acid aminotransferase/4-amino-4-deoxychorismate lyase